MELENKLLAYRSKKKTEQNIEKLKDTFTKMFKSNKKHVEFKEELENEVLLTPDASESDTEPTLVQQAEDTESPEITRQKLAFYVMLFVAWAGTYMLLIKLQFGTVFLIVSMLIFIYFNTRTGPRRRNEVSAYSVFNKNCESIDGSINAEQFEKELRFGGLY